MPCAPYAGPMVSESRCLILVNTRPYAVLTARTGRSIDLYAVEFDTPENCVRELKIMSNVSEWQLFARDKICLPVQE